MICLEDFQGRFPFFQNWSQNLFATFFLQNLISFILNKQTASPLPLSQSWFISVLSPSVSTPDTHSLSLLYSHTHSLPCCTRTHTLSLYSPTITYKHTHKNPLSVITHLSIPHLIRDHYHQPLRNFFLINTQPHSHNLESAIKECLPQESDNRLLLKSQLYTP